MSLRVFHQQSVQKPATPYEEKRPWGSFRQFSHNETSTTKLLHVSARQPLSLQSHAYRNEFWRVLTGDPIISIDGTVAQAKPGDEFFIPQGAKHRIQGGEQEAVILEVARGNFIESDNTRYDDAFGRSSENDFKTVAVSGYFFPMNTEFIRLLEKARAIGDRVVAIINNEEQYQTFRRTSIYASEEERARIMTLIAPTADIVFADDVSRSVSRTLAQIKPDIFLNQGPVFRASHQLPEHQVCATHGIEMLFDDMREKPQCVVAVSGYFNPLHPGHINMFRSARALGDRLVVIVNSDAQVAIKGSVPFMPGHVRCEIIRNLACVDDVVLSIDTDGTVCHTLSQLNPDIFANAGDRKNIDDIPEARVCREQDIEMKFGVCPNNDMGSSLFIKGAHDFLLDKK